MVLQVRYNIPEDISTIKSSSDLMHGWHISYPQQSFEVFEAWLGVKQLDSIFAWVYGFASCDVGPRI